MIRMGIFNDSLISSSFELFLVLWELDIGSIIPFLVEVLDGGLVHVDLWWSQGDTLGQEEVGVTDKGLQNPEEWLLVLVVGLGRDIIVLEVSGSVESDLSGSDSPVLLVHLVPHQNDRDALADPGEILVPLGNVLVGDSGGDIEHHNGGMSSNVVPLSEPSELLLPGGIPQIELDGPSVGVEDDGTHIDSLSG